MSTEPEHKDTPEDLQKAFEQGFSEARGEEQTPTPPAPAPQPAEASPPAVAQEVKPEIETPEPVAKDEPEPSPLEKKVSELEKLLGTSLQRLKSAEGRVAALQREREKPTPQAPEPEKPNPAIEKMRQDYPDIADQADAAIKHAIEAARKDGNLTSAQVEEIVSKRTSAILDAIVEKEHRGWKNDVKKPEFVAWLEQQPENIKSLAESDSPLDAIDLLDKFKAAKKGPPKDTRALDAASVVGSARNNPPATVISDEAAFEHGFNSVMAATHRR